MYTDACIGVDRYIPARSYFYTLSYVVGQMLCVHTAQVTCTFDSGCVVSLEVCVAHGVSPCLPLKMFSFSAMVTGQPGYLDFQRFDPVPFSQRKDAPLQPKNLCLSGGGGGGGANAACLLNARKVPERHSQASASRFGIRRHVLSVFRRERLRSYLQPWGNTMLFRYLLGWINPLNIALIKSYQPEWTMRSGWGDAVGTASPGAEKRCGFIAR